MLEKSFLWAAIFRIHLLLQNILASFSYEVHGLCSGKCEEGSNGLCMAAMPESCSVSVSPADVLEGTSCFIEGFYSPFVLFTLSTSHFKGDDQKYNPFMFQSLDC